MMMEELHSLHTGQHHFHEHTSDNDYESDIDDEFNYKRRRKASDDRSFHSPTPNGVGKLHHRNFRPSNNGDDLRSQSMSPLHHKGRRVRVVPASSKKRTFWGRAMQWFILLLVIGYIALMYSVVLWMRHNRPFFTESLSSQSSFLEPRGRVFVLRERLEQRRLDDRNFQASKTRDNAAKRAQRSRPPDQQLLPIEQYEITPVEPKRGTASSPRAITPAKVHDLCGEHAKLASKANPLNYPTENALNSKSRVLITGILNPVGIHLALTLKERCGVEIIGGIDPAFPNTVAHRLALQKRIELLSTNIPKLVQPILQPIVGLDPKTSTKTPVENLSTTGEIDLSQNKYTHVIHLASYSLNEYQDFGDETVRNTQSPYVFEGHRPELFALRSSYVAMEQILLSLAEGVGARKEPGPQFTFASTIATNDIMHSSLKLIDEIMAKIYSSMYGVYSNAIRLPNIYGPWGRDGTPIHDFSRAVIEHHRHNNGTSITIDDLQSRDFVYVDDIVDAIIVSMQYRDQGQSSSVLDLSSDVRTTLNSVSTYVSRLIHSKSSELSREIVDPKTSDTQPSDLAIKSRSVLRWSAVTPLAVGLGKTFAWYLDDIFPYGNKIDVDARLMTGDQLLARLGIETCPPEDLLCHKGRKYLPCISECSIKERCTPSILDDVAKLVSELTDDCDIVLYMQAMGYDVRDIKLQAAFKESKKTMVCNLAFVPEESRLVSAVIKKVPEAQLHKFGIASSVKESADLFKKLKFERLNGRLLYKGWILVWVKGTNKSLAPYDFAALKLSPGRLFSSNVRHAIFVDESFPVSPTYDDVLFLVGQVSRPALPARNAYRKAENGKKRKYRLAAEPERRAVMLLSPLKHKRMTDGGEMSKISVYEATKYMQVEVGEDPEKESSSLKKQREFYERVPTFTNRLDFRSINEAWYKYDLRHWVRSRWIVHDLKLEEARQLRCDWYQEHIQWGNGLDQLSFAHVMMVRDLERRIAFQEPDDHIKPARISDPVLLSLTDAHEWHPLASEQNRVAFENIPLSAFSVVPDHIVDKEEKEQDSDDGLVHSVQISKDHDENVPLFVRVASERVMVKARLAWSEAHRGSLK